MSQSNQHFRCNTAVNGGSRAPYKAPSNILNKGICITPSSSGTIISTSTGVINTIGQVVTYQAVNTPIQPYRIVTKGMLPSAETASGRSCANPNQILNFSSLTYGNNSYPNQNLYIATDNRGEGASGYGSNRELSSQNTSSLAPDKPEAASKTKNSRGSQKPKSIKVSRKKLTSLDVDSKKKLTASSSVSNYMKKDISDKEMEILEQMDDQSLTVVVSKVMDMTNRMCGDYMAEQLTKHLGQEKYNEIARGGIPPYTEFLLSRKQSEELNRLNNPVGDTNMVQSLSDIEADLYRENDQLESARSDPRMIERLFNKQTDQLEAASSAVGVPGAAQKRNVIVESVRPDNLIGCRRDVPSGVAVMTKDGAIEEQKFTGQGTQKNVSPQETTPPLTPDINYSKVSGFLLTADTKAIAEEVLAQEEKLAADMIITKKIDEFKKMDTSGSSNNDSSFEDKWSFNYSKVENGLPDKIFESPEELQAKNLRRSSENQYYQLNIEDKNKVSKQEEQKQTEEIKKYENKKFPVKEQKNYPGYRSQPKNLIQLDGTDKNGCNDRRSSVGFIHVTAENSLVTCETPIASSKNDTKASTDDPGHIKKIRKNDSNLSYTKSYTVVNKLKVPRVRSKNEKKTIKNQESFQYDPLLSNSNQSISESICVTSSSSEMSAESSGSSLDNPKVVAELLSPIMTPARGVSKKLGSSNNTVVQNVENTVVGATSTPKKNVSKITQQREKLKTLLSSIHSPKEKPKCTQLPEISIISINNSENDIHTEKYTKLKKILSEAVLLQNGLAGDYENKQKVVLATPEKKKAKNENIPTLKSKKSPSVNKENAVSSPKNTIRTPIKKTGFGKNENQDLNKSKRKVSNKENMPVSPKIKKQELNFLPVKPVLKETNTFQSKYVEQVENLKNIISAKEFWNTGRKYQINPVSVTVYNRSTKKIVENCSKVSPNTEKQSSKYNADEIKKNDTSTSQKVAESPNLIKNIPKEKVINVIDHQIIKPDKLEDQGQEKLTQESTKLSVSPNKLENNGATPQINQYNEDLSISETSGTIPSNCDNTEPAVLENKGTDSPDIETSMNDLAELLMSLQESEPIFSYTSVPKDNKKDQDSLDPKMAMNIVEDESLNDAAQALIDIQRSSFTTAKISPDVNVKTELVQVYVDVESVVEVKAADDNFIMADVDKNSPKVPKETECTNFQSMDELKVSQDTLLLSVTEKPVVESPDVQNNCCVDAVQTLIDIEPSIVKAVEISTDLNIKTKKVVVFSDGKLVQGVKPADDECIVIEDDEELPEVPDGTKFGSTNASKDCNKDASVEKPVFLPIIGKKVILLSHDVQTKIATEPDRKYEACDQKITPLLEKDDKQGQVDDDDCVIVEASGSIVDTPLGFGNINRYRDPFFCRRLMKLNEQRQRKLLRNRVKFLSKIILKRIRTVIRTYTRFRSLVSIILFNVNDTSLDNITLRSKVRNLNALYKKISVTGVDLRKKGARSDRFLSGARKRKRGVGERKMKMGEAFRRYWKLREERTGSKDEKKIIGKYEDKVLSKPIRTYTKETKNTKRPSVSKICTTPRKKEKVSPNLCFFDDTEKLDNSDVKTDPSALSGKKTPKTSPEMQAFIKPMKTYLKKRSTMTSKSDSNICTTPYNRANVFFNRSRSFVDDIRKSSLDRDDKRDKTSPESIVHCIIYKDATPILNSITQKAKWKIVEMPAVEEAKNEPWPEVVVKEEPEDFSDEKIVDSPKTGRKLKRSGTVKQIKKPTLVAIKEEPEVFDKEIGQVKNLTPTCAMSLRPRTRLSEIPKHLDTPCILTPGKKTIVSDAKSPGKDTPRSVTRGIKRKISDDKSLGKDFETPVRKLREKRKETPNATPETKSTAKTPLDDGKKTVNSTSSSKKKSGITPKKNQKTPVSRKRADRTPSDATGQKYSLRERRAGNSAAEY